MLDQMTHLFRLKAIVEAGSFRRAATILNVTQPALTRSIAQLEKKFGNPLLVRHARGIVPTTFGNQVLASVNRLSRHWELLENGFNHSNGILQKEIRLSAGPLWRSIILPSVLPELQSDFPNIRIKIQNNSVANPITEITEGRVDVFFASVELNIDLQERLIKKQFTTVTDQIVARENHPIFQENSNGKMINPMRLLDFSWIVYTGDPIYEIETIHKTSQHLGRSPDIHIRSESLITTLALLQNGDYLCILPAAAIANMKAPRILPVPIDLGERKIQSGALYREENKDWPPLVKLLDLCASKFNKLAH